jgi:hypothetical protein
MRACACYGVAWQSVISIGEGGVGGVFEGIDPAQGWNDLEPLKLDPRPPACIDMICMQVHMSGRQAAYVGYSKYCAGLHQLRALALPNPAGVTDLQ